ncbi:hypothetical protein M758_7G138700, partial [Ceratodon purpureus]
MISPQLMGQDSVFSWWRLRYKYSASSTCILQQQCDHFFSAFLSHLLFCTAASIWGIFAISSSVRARLAITILNLHHVELQEFPKHKVFQGMMSLCPSATHSL